MLGRLGIVLLALIASTAITLSGNSFAAKDPVVTSVQDHLQPPTTLEPRLIWQTPTSQTYGPPAASDTSIFLTQFSQARTGSPDLAPGGGVHAYDREKGELLWVVDENSASFSPVIYSNGAVFFAAAEVDGPNAEKALLGIIRLYRLNADTGVIEWTKNVIGDDIYSLRMTDHSTIELASKDTDYRLLDHENAVLSREQVSIASFDVEEGQAIRQIDLDDTVVHSNIATTKDEFFVISNGQFSDGGLAFAQGRALRVYDLTDGAQKREITLPPEVAGDSYLAVDESKIYVATDYSGPPPQYSLVTALDGDSGEVIWTFKTDLNGGVTPLIMVNDNLLIQRLRGVIYGLDATTGQKLWEFGHPGNQRRIGTPTVHDNVVYFGEIPQTVPRAGTPKEGSLVALDATSGSLLWRHETDGGVHDAPYVDDNLIALTTAINGRLRVLDRDPSPIDTAPASEIETLYTGVLESQHRFGTSVFLKIYDLSGRELASVPEPEGNKWNPIGTSSDGRIFLASDLGRPYPTSMERSVRLNIVDVFNSTILATSQHRGEMPGKGAVCGAVFLAPEEFWNVNDPYLFIYSMKTARLLESIPLPNPYGETERYLRFIEGITCINDSEAMVSILAATSPDQSAEMSRNIYHFDRDSGFRRVARITDRVSGSQSPFPVLNSASRAGHYWGTFGSNLILLGQAGVLRRIHVDQPDNAGKLRFGADIGTHVIVYRPVEVVIDPKCPESQSLLEAPVPGWGGQSRDGCVRSRTRYDLFAYSNLDGSLAAAYASHPDALDIMVGRDGTAYILKDRQIDRVTFDDKDFASHIEPWSGPFLGLHSGGLVERLLKAK